MATETKTKYVCDSCDKSTGRRELHRFIIEERSMDRQTISTAHVDLCSDCEALLHKALKPLMSERQYEKIEGIVR